MFVPRALRLKGVREPQRPRPANLPQVVETSISKDDALVDAMEGISTNSPEPRNEPSDPKAVARGPRFTVKPITAEYLAQLVAGMELIFSDYAHQEDGRAKWLQQRYRTVDEEGKFIHLTAILEHPNISTMKPEATQVLLQQALREHPSTMIELASNGYHVRRFPTSYPPKFLPHNSFEVVNDDGLSFWDQRTIYVEPHLRNLCQTPAKLAYWLKEHGQMRFKWLPVQAVHMLWNSCAFVVLSGNVMHEGTWTKWRATDKPDNWKVMTKVEHTRRTAEYIALLEKQNPRGMRKAQVEDDVPAIAKPASLALNVEVVPAYTEATTQPKAKRKRKRRKGNKDDQDTDQVDDDGGTNAMTKAADVDEPGQKRRA
ncbi:hypothetical protein EK21DRAFT_106516 [Setomelanomma holmii]|uniref:Uncharacterized protein n=1 Tax=Setomelanomma holmii TaxID=210430 RepID=A0A9P4HMS8_9PLEO|nr:hypothetical protein EK21DRAFT_106516 [Setomelanomma holmii]